MAVFKRYEPSSEKELHHIIEKNLDALEEGLRLIEYEIPLPRGIPDFLAVDSGGRLVIVEVKLNEDENIIFQALRYFLDVSLNRYVLASTNKEHHINAKEEPRIVLVAEHFSDDLRNMSSFVTPEIELFEYSVWIDSAEAQGIVFHQVRLPELQEEPVELPSIDDHRGYITKGDLHPVYDKIRSEMKAIGKGVEEYRTRSYVAFKYKGKLLGGLSGKRRAFDFWVVPIVGPNKLNEPTVGIRIGNPDEDYQKYIDIARRSYENLGR